MTLSRCAPSLWRHYRAKMTVTTNKNRSKNINKIRRNTSELVWRGAPQPSDDTLGQIRAFQAFSNSQLTDSFKAPSSPAIIIIPSTASPKCFYVINCFVLRCRGFLRSLGGACYDSTWIIQDGWESNFQRNFDVSPFLGQKTDKNRP